MLYYLEAGVSLCEVPNEKTLLIYISGRMNNCPECHYSELRKSNNGTILMNNYKKLIDIYLNYITCICFLGEGDNNLKTRSEFNELCAYARNKKLKTCLYSGRDCQIEKWMNCFDYIKVGSYKKEKGPLTSKTTNQLFYKKTRNNSYVNITNMFWS